MEYNIFPQIDVVKNVKPSTPNEIQAISGATISSKAVVRILNENIQIIKNLYESSKLVMAKKKTSLCKEFLKGLWDENPVLRMLLGLCPTLAVTNSAINGLAMGLATTFVLLSSSIIISIA